MCDRNSDPSTYDPDEDVKHTHRDDRDANEAICAACEKAEAEA